MARAGVVARLQVEHGVANTHHPVHAGDAGLFHGPEDEVRRGASLRNVVTADNRIDHPVLPADRFYDEVGRYAIETGIERDLDAALAQQLEYSDGACDRFDTTRFKEPCKVIAKVVEYCVGQHFDFRSVMPRHKMSDSVALRRAANRAQRIVADFDAMLAQYRREGFRHLA